MSGVDVVYLAWGALAMGILTRVLGPYLVKLYFASKDDAKLVWDWVYLRGQLFLVALVFLVLPLILPDMKSVSEMGLQEAWLRGFAVADIGRELDKIFPEVAGWVVKQSQRLSAGK